MRIYDLKTGKKKIRWRRFCLIAVFLYIAALTIPYVQHKKVSDHYNTKTSKFTLIETSLN